VCADRLEFRGMPPARVFLLRNRFLSLLLCAGDGGAVGGMESRVERTFAAIDWCRLASAW